MLINRNSDGLVQRIDLSDGSLIVRSVGGQTYTVQAADATITIDTSEIELFAVAFATMATTDVQPRVRNSLLGATRKITQLLK